MISRHIAPSLKIIRLSNYRQSNSSWPVSPCLPPCLGPASKVFHSKKRREKATTLAGRRRRRKQPWDFLATFSHLLLYFFSARELCFCFFLFLWSELESFILLHFDLRDYFFTRKQKNVLREFSLLVHSQFRKKPFFHSSCKMKFSKKGKVHDFPFLSSLRNMCAFNARRGGKKKKNFLSLPLLVDFRQWGSEHHARRGVEGIRGQRGTQKKRKRGFPNVDTNNKICNNPNLKVFFGRVSCGGVQCV